MFLTDLSVIHVLMKRFWFRFKRSKLIQLEYSCSFLFPMFVLMIHLYFKEVSPGVLDYPYDNESELGYELTKFIKETGNLTFIVMPDNDKTRYLVNSIIKSFHGKFDIKSLFVNSSKVMKTELYKHDTNGIVIEWNNSDQIDAETNPSINVYYQAFTSPPTKDVFRLIKRVFANQQIKPRISSMVVNSKSYATGYYVYYTSFKFTVMIFAGLPILIAILPVIQVLMDDRESKMYSLMILHGCKEWQIWISTLFACIIVSIPPLLLYEWILIEKTLFSQSSQTLYFLFSFLYIIALVLYLFTFIIIMHNSSMVNFIPVFTFLLSLFCAFFIKDSTYPIYTKSMGIPFYILSLFPFSLYEIFAVHYYYTAMLHNSITDWSSFNEEIFLYSFSSLLSLFLLRIVLYFILFIIFLNLDKIKKFIRRKSISLLKNNQNEVEDSPDTSLRVSSLSKIYHGISKPTHALDNISFSTMKGELLMIIGPNGAGKSTLINILSGIIPPSTGTLYFQGKVVSNDFSIIQKHIGICFQENVFDEWQTVRENLEMFSKFRRITQNELQDFMDTFCQAIALDNSFDIISKNVSGGQKRKLCIALSVMTLPPLIIMDEPIAGVDSLSRIAIWDAISKIKDSTIIATSHALDEAATLASRIMLIEHGKINFLGSIEQMKKDYHCGYIMSVEPSQYSEDAYNFCKKFIPSSTMQGTKIWFPITDDIDEMLEAFDKIMPSLNIQYYSFTVEQIEDIVTRTEDINDNIIDVY